MPRIWAGLSEIDNFTLWPYFTLLPLFSDTLVSVVLAMLLLVQLRPLTASLKIFRK